VRLRVIWFGRPAADSFSREVATYRQRVGRRWPAEDTPLKPQAGGRDRDPRRALTVEADVVRRSLPAGWRWVALDESGDSVTSPELASWIDGLEVSGVAGLAFVIGSDLGIDPDLLREADRRLSLGRLTLPHRIARLVLWEQLFRATHIVGGGGYHRPSVQ
jgi:23S rRNA (pseudouridine1915-N3)-methyltransferase